MASFDIIDCTSQSYKFLWTHRNYVLRFSAPVIILKILGFATFVLLGMEENFLRQGLLLLPVYFLEGWVIAQLVLMALQLEHTPKNMPGVQKAQNGQTLLPKPEHVQRNVKASAIVYTLTKLALAFIIGMTMQGQDGLETPDAPSAASNEMFIVVLMIITMVVWAFRFFWIYIPVLFGKTPLQYLLRFKAFSSSFFLLGVWMLCFVPMAILMLMSTEVMAVVLSIFSLQEDATAFQIGLAIIQGAIDYLLALVSSLAVAFGVFSVFNDENKTTPIW